MQGTLIPWDRGKSCRKQQGSAHMIASVMGPLHAQVNVTQANHATLGTQTINLLPQSGSSMYVNNGQLYGLSKVVQPSSPYNSGTLNNYIWCQAQNTNATTDQGDLIAWIHFLTWPILHACMRPQGNAPDCACRVCGPGQRLLWIRRWLGQLPWDRPEQLEQLLQVQQCAGCLHCGVRQPQHHRSVQRLQE